MEEKTKGATFLKVTGILMIIGGAIGFIGDIIMITGTTLLAAFLGNEFNMSIYYFATIVIIVRAVLELIAGIIGIVNSNKPEKAMTCIIWGAIVAVFSVVGNILVAVTGADFSILSLATGLVLPVLFIVGGVKNRQG